MARRILWTAASLAILVLATGCGQSPTAPEVQAKPTATSPSLNQAVLAAE